MNVKTKGMKNIARAFATLGLWNKILVLLVLVAWLLLTLALAQDWRQVRQVVTWVNGQFSLGVLINLVQIAILVSVWYQVGASKTMVKLYQKDTTANFRRVDREQARQDSESSQTAQRVAKLEGEVDILRDVVLKRKDNETRNMA